MPLGSDADKQYHLWWTGADSQAALRGDRAGRDGLRADREQGDNPRLDADTVGDYLALATAPTSGRMPPGARGPTGRRPQRATTATCCCSPARPGRARRLRRGPAGHKSVTLHHVVVGAGRGRRGALLLVAAAETDVRCVDLTTLAGEINGTDVARQTLHESLARFDGGGRGAAARPRPRVEGSPRLAVHRDTRHHGRPRRA